MNPHKYIVFENKHKKFVKGKSIIDHSIRVGLGITCIEYVFLDYLKGFYESRTGRIKYADLWIETGISPEHIVELWTNLAKKDLVYYDKKTGIVKVSDKWHVLFNKTDEFDAFWSAYGRKDDKLIGNVGNRQNALKNYRNAVKTISPDDLFQKMLLYIQNCLDCERRIMHASSWLSPTVRHWENELVVESKGIVKEEPIDPAMKNMVM